MHRGVSQKCVRCIVQLSLHKVSWQDSEKRDVHLNGPMVFLRACVLGQLQHSHLHQPFFPIDLNQQLQFDRVFTNCKNPLLFNEMLRGEHVKIEVIQISEDYTGGRVLARYEDSAHAFLFPDEPESQDREVRHIQLTKRSKAVQNKTPPVLSFSTSTILLEATVHSPVSPPLVVKQGTCGAGSDHSSSAQHSPASADISRSPLGGPAADVGGGRTTPNDASAPATPPRRNGELSSCEPALTPRTRVQFRPHRHSEGSGCGGGGGEREDLQANSGGALNAEDSSKPLYRTVTSDVGLHSWEVCPRRTPEKAEVHWTPTANSCSSPSRRKKCTESTVQLLPNLTPADELHLENTDPALYPCPLSGTIPKSRPPFVVRRADPSMLSRRDFCGSCSAPSVVRHFKRTSEVAAGNERPALTPPPSAATEEEVDFPARRSGPSLSELYEKYLGGTGTIPELASSRQTKYDADTPARPGAKLTCSAGREADAAALMSDPGNARSGALSPAKRIEEKVRRLRKECCSHVQHSDGEAVIEDSLNEDLNRLRAAMAAERNEVFSKSALPYRSATVKLGPEDYWSEKMAEYTGRPHRLLFDETLEKIYHRLYQNASVIK